MNKIFKVLSLVLLVCLGIFALVGCGENNSIVGYWKNDELGYDFIYTFKEDGTGNYNAAGIDMPFTYKINGDKLSIDFNDGSEIMDSTFELKDDVLNIKDATDEFVAYKRVDASGAVPVNVPDRDEGEGVVTIDGEGNTVEDEDFQGGYAGMNIPLKDNYDEAEYQIKVAFQDWLREVYGDAVFDARIYVEKIYTYEDEQEVEALKEMNLGPNEVACEINYELKPAEGADINLLTVPNGNYDEETGWIEECSRLGILRPASGDSEAAYVLTNVGTGW